MGKLPKKIKISIGKCLESDKGRDLNWKVKRTQRFQWKSKEKVEISTGKSRESRDCNRQVKRK